MIRGWDALVRMSSRRERGDALAVFRVLAALAILYSLLSIAAADLVDVLWVAREHGGMQHVFASPLLELMGGATPGNVWALWIAALIADLLLLVGLFGRVSAFVLLQSYVALSSTNGLASGGYDMLITNALWLMVLGDTTATASVDCYRRHRRFTSDDLVAVWPRLALVWQIALVYFFTGIQKASAPWTPGGGYTALYWVMHDPTFMRFDGSGLAVALLPLTRIGTAVAWHWEHLSILLPLVLHFRATKDRPGRLRALFNRVDLRLVWAAIGVTMHLGILLMLNAGPFSLISVSYYVALFAPDEVRAVLARFAPTRAASSDLVGEGEPA